MTLEDFFTLTEMTNGLATLGRVEELISIMQQRKDSATSTISDSSRQGSSVASTLTATENKDCLNHFVKLNGLCYLNQLLQESLNFGNDTVDRAVEELLIALLGSLERLPISAGDSAASGIQLTVEQLVGSKSVNIEKKARALSERWKNAAENGVTDQDMTKDEKTNQIMPASSSNSAVASANTDDVDALPPSFVLNSSETNDSSLNPIVEVTSGVTVCSKADDHCVASVLKDGTPKDMKIVVDTKGGSPSKLGRTESGNVATSSGLSVSSHARKREHSLSCNFDAEEIKSHELETTETTKDDLGKAFESAGEVKGKSILAVKKSIVETDQRSELALECGEIDALEVARQVAIEVEREVVDYREPFCCSSPDDDSSSSYNEEEEREGKGLDNSKPMADESGEKTERNRHAFDLNEDARADEGSDRLTNRMSDDAVHGTVPIVVAASRGAVFLPDTRPRFGGELGWKGPSATSAFRAPSPRRTSSDHKRKAEMMDLDLNVEARDDDARDSAEASSRRADGSKFDLNCLGDEDVALPHQYGDQTMSSASSSSSRERATRGFDLNDSLDFLGAMGSHDIKKLISEASDDPFITIMGSRISLRTPPIHQSPLPAYGYSGPVMGSSMSFPPPFYPHLMDSRDAAAGVDDASSPSTGIPSFLAINP